MNEEEKATTYKWYNLPFPSNNSGANQICEFDQLFSLELGGADTLDNIWPQCGPSGVALPQRFFKEKGLNLSREETIAFTDACTRSQSLSM